MKRRKFISIAAVGSAVIAIPTIGFSSNAFFKQAVTSIIHRELGYLKLDEQGVNKFVDDFTVETNSRSLSSSQKMKMKVGSEYLFPGSVDTTLVKDRIVTLFLLSSDFFINKMNEKRTVQYIGLFDSNKKPCTNPFSHLYYPQHHQTSV